MISFIYYNFFFNKKIEELRIENQSLSMNTRGSFGNMDSYAYEEKNRELLRKIQEM